MQRCIGSRLPHDCGSGEVCSHVRFKAFPFIKHIIHLYYISVPLTCSAAYLFLEGIMDRDSHGPKFQRFMHLINTSTCFDDMVIYDCNVNGQCHMALLLLLPSCYVATCLRLSCHYLPFNACRGRQLQEALVDVPGLPSYCQEGFKSPATRSGL